MILYDGDVNVYFADNEVDQGDEQVFNLSIPFEYLSLSAGATRFGSGKVQVQMTRKNLNALAGGLLERVCSMADGELVRQQEWEYERSNSERDAIEAFNEEDGEDG